MAWAGVDTGAAIPITKTTRQAQARRRNLTTGCLDVGRVRLKGTFMRSAAAACAVSA